MSSVLVLRLFLPKKTGFARYFFQPVPVSSRSFGAKRDRLHKRPLAAGGSHCVPRVRTQTLEPKAVCNLPTKLGATPAEALDDAASVAATMKYMVFHALACHLSFVSSALCMTYIYVHLFFALAGLVFSLYLGSAWYDRMLTSHVTKKVRKHIAASTAKKD